VINPEWLISWQNSSKWGQWDNGELEGKIPELMKKSEVKYFVTLAL
jgi:hypothetical protein